MEETFARVLSRCAERYLDDPALADVDRRYSERLLYSTWVPLARVDGVSGQVRALAWIGAWGITRQWGEEFAPRVEETAVAGAWGQLAPFEASTSFPRGQR